MDEMPCAAEDDVTWMSLNVEKSFISEWEFPEAQLNLIDTIALIKFSHLP